MAFKKGDKKPENSGRKEGTPNKRSFDARLLAEQLGCDPVEVLLRAALGDWEWFGFTAEKTQERPSISFRDRVEAAREAAPYIHQKLKAIEHSGQVEAIIKTIDDLVLEAEGKNVKK